MGNFLIYFKASREHKIEGNENYSGICRVEWWLSVVGCSHASVCFDVSTLGTDWHCLSQHNLLNWEWQTDLDWLNTPHHRIAEGSQYSCSSVFHFYTRYNQSQSELQLSLEVFHQDFFLKEIIFKRHTHQSWLPTRWKMFNEWSK